MKALVQQVGRRGAFLLWLAILDLVYAFSLFHPTEQSTNNPTSKFLSNALPLWGWGFLWLAVGLACLFFAFRKKDRIAFGAAMFLKVLWGVFFLIGWLQGEVERGYLSFIFWATFAAAVAIVSGWRENIRLDPSAFAADHVSEADTHVSEADPQ